MSNEFLRKLYNLSDGEYKIIEKYKVGAEIGVSNSQTDDIVDDLDKMGLVKIIDEIEKKWAAFLIMIFKSGPSYLLDW